MPFLVFWVNFIKLGLWHWLHIDIPLWTTYIKTLNWYGQMVSLTLNCEKKISKSFQVITLKVGIEGEE